MPNVRASSGMIGTQRLPMSLSLIRSLSSRTKAIVVATFCLPEPSLDVGERLRRPGAAAGLAACAATAAEPPSACAPLLQVRDLVGVLARVVVRRR